MLTDAGIDVETGLLETKGLALNKRFFTAMTEKRPFVILKWAQTKDGFIARKDFSSKWISGENARKLVHQWRASEDAIMVGTNTARYDNPSLNVRFDIPGNNPLRLVIDRKLELSNDLHLFDGSQPTICYNEQKNEEQDNLTFKQLDFNQAIFPQVLTDLYHRNIHSVFVEGGQFLLNSIISNDLWDEARIFTGTTTFNAGIEAPQLTGDLVDQKVVGDDLLHIYQNPASTK